MVEVNVPSSGAPLTGAVVSHVLPTCLHPKSEQWPTHDTQRQQEICLGLCYNTALAHLTPRPAPPPHPPPRAGPPGSAIWGSWEIWTRRKPGHAVVLTSRMAHVQACLDGGDKAVKQGKV